MYALFNDFDVKLASLCNLVDSLIFLLIFVFFFSLIKFFFIIIIKTKFYLLQGRINLHYSLILGNYIGLQL